MIVPREHLRSISQRVRIWEQGEMVVLPHEEAPRVTIFEAAGKWQAELVNGRRNVAHREVLVIDGVRWRLELPEIVDATIESATARPGLVAISLEFAVSRDEEHTELTVCTPAGKHRLRPPSDH